jgi:hypothetical protein
MDLNIDNEWENFISCSCDDISSDDESNETTGELLSADLSFTLSTKTPKASNIYISTKTNIAYLNTSVDLKDVFWKIPIIPYYQPCNGVVKKQMKFNSLVIEDLNNLQTKLSSENYYEQHIITHIDNPTGRIKFKDTRKVSIGISKKDILSYRCKKKSAFYNCFVLILRIKILDTFKEFHVKVFNTGKLEIPGVQSDIAFNMILKELLEIMQPHIEVPLNYKENSSETVLINSNFNCGFYINRESLYDILKLKYNIQAIYDPCSYPGIQCKFYYNPNSEIQNGCQNLEENKNIKDVSFMIFRTGSVLIVGRCEEYVIMIIYEFIKNILHDEYINIFQKNNKIIEDIKIKKKKICKKNIIIDNLN